jgi:hypothetical protein
VPQEWTCYDDTPSVLKGKNCVNTKQIALKADAIYAELKITFNFDASDY